ncbi:MAG: glycosyltransferase family 39 protein [Anaerolineae bacterium]
MKLSSRPALLLTVFLGLALRLINLNARPLWYDEAFAVLYSEKSLAAMVYGTVTRVQGAAADVHPLFYYFSLHYWMSLFGQSPLAVRLPSVLAGVLTIGLAYLIGRALWDAKTGLLAGVLVAVSPFHIAYSQETRMYALLGLAASASLYSFIRAWGSGRRRWWLAYGLCGAITLYAHNLGFLNILAIDLWAVWCWWRVRRVSFFPEMVWSHGLMLALFSPWLMLVPSQLGKIEQSYWVQQPGPAELVQTLITFHTNLPLPGWAVPPALFLSLLVVTLVGVELVRLQRPGQAPAPNLGLPLLGAWVPIVVLFAVSQYRPVYIIRALLPAALAYYQLIALVLARGLMPRSLKGGLSAAVLAFLLFSLSYHYTFAGFPRPPFVQAAAALSQNVQDGQTIVHSNKLTFFPMHYYRPDLAQTFIADPAGDGSDTLAYPTQEALGLFAAPTIEAAARGQEAIWFVIFRRAEQEYLAAGYTGHPHKLWLDEHYRLAGKLSFNDLDIYRYEAR